jgi:hypothetical protein
MVIRSLFLMCCFFVSAVAANAQSCDSTIRLGFGDTTKPSDTRFASQWCRGSRSTADSISTRGFVPGSGDRIFNNSLMPCERIRSAALYCGSKKISQASIRPGCANGRLTFDFCGPKGGGAREIDAACKGKPMTVEVTRRNGSTFCYNPPGANMTFRNGKIEPNRTTK